MNNNVYIYLFVAAAVIYLVRALPLTLIRKNITNKFIRSFLYYVPYVTLAVMTFPAILYSTGSMVSATMGFLVALLIAYIDGNLFKVAIGSCAIVFLVEMFI